MAKLPLPPNEGRTPPPHTPPLDPEGVRERTEGPTLGSLLIPSGDRELLLARLRGLALDGMQDRVALEEATVLCFAFIYTLLRLPIRSKSFFAKAAGRVRGRSDEACSRWGCRCLLSMVTKTSREASLAWLVGSIRRAIADLKVGQGGLIGEHRDENALRKLGGAIEELKEKLRSPELATLAQRIPNDKWFRPLYDAENLRQLSERLDKLELDRRPPGMARFSWRYAYGALHGRWSSAVHASDSGRVVRLGPNGDPVLHEIRNQHALTEVIPMVAGLALEAMRLQLHRFRRDQELAMRAWYALKVRDRFAGVGTCPSGHRLNQLSRVLLTRGVVYRTEAVRNRSVGCLMRRLWVRAPGHPTSPSDRDSRTISPLAGLVYTSSRRVLTSWL